MVLQKWLPTTSSKGLCQPSLSTKARGLRKPTGQPTSPSLQPTLVLSKVRRSFSKTHGYDKKLLVTFNNKQIYLTKKRHETCAIVFIKDITRVARVYCLQRFLEPLASRKVLGWTRPIQTAMPTAWGLTPKNPNITFLRSRNTQKSPCSFSFKVQLS